jgi:hypothetical protein
MPGDITGDAIAQGARGLSDGHFAYTAALERAWSVDYEGSEASVTRQIVAGLLSEDLQTLRWSAHGRAGAAGGTVSVTFGGTTLLSFAVSANEAFHACGEVTRLAAASQDSIATGLTPPSTVAVVHAAPVVDLTVAQDLVASITGLNSFVYLLRTVLSGAP